jgi:hypothetical protein
MALAEVPDVTHAPVVTVPADCSVQRKQSPDSGGEPLRPPTFVQLHVGMVVEQKAVSQPSARQVLALLFDHAGAGLQERRERVLGYFVDHNPRERGDPGRQRTANPSAPSPRTSGHRLTRD